MSWEFATAYREQARTGAPIPRFVLDLLAATPRAGEGVHNWLFRMARVLHPYRTEDEIAAILRAAVADCGRFVPEQEIQDAIRNSKACAWQLDAGHAAHIQRSAKWPELNGEQREAIIASGAGLHDLWENSPVRFEDGEPHTEEIIDALFPGNPWLCVGASDHDFKTRHRDELRGKLSAFALIVPSPMTRQTGKTQEGKTSEHTLDATGPRRSLVVEFDSGTTDDHAALLLHLAEHAPLAVAVYSGGKSLHGWFYCGGQSEDAMRRFMRYAVSLGADPATWTRSQFVRMPDGTRDNGARQVVYFFNPAVADDAR